MSKKIKMLSLVVAFVVSISSFVGCSSKEGVNDKKGDETKVEAVVEKAEPVELHIISRKLGIGDENNNLIKPELEKKLNLKLNWEIKPATDYSQQGQIILASGSYPDMMEVWWTDSNKQIEEFAQDKVIIPLDELIAKYGANIMKNRPKESFYISNKDNKMYAIPSRFAEYGFEQTYTIRQDWLDKLGLKMPSTLDEFYNVAKAFTLNDPDGNGKNDTVGVGLGMGTKLKSLVSNSSFEIIAGAHGIVNNQWNVVNGKLVFWGVMPEMKDAISYFRKLYQEGFVEQEFPIISREQYLEKKNQGKYGIEWWWATNLNEATSQWWRDFMKNVPQAKTSFLTPLKAKDGKQRVPGSSIKAYGVSVPIFAKSKNPDKCIQLIDYLASDEGAELAAYGLKGQHWEEKDGIIVTKDISEAEKTKSGADLYAWFFKQKFFMRDTIPFVRQSLDIMKPGLVRPVDLPINNDPNSAAKLFSAALSDMTLSRLTKIVVEKGIDPAAEFDKYVKDWYEQGGQKLTDELNAEYTKIKK